MGKIITLHCQINVFYNSKMHSLQIPNKLHMYYWNLVKKSCLLRWKTYVGPYTRYNWCTIPTTFYYSTFKHTFFHPVFLLKSLLQIFSFGFNIFCFNLLYLNTTAKLPKTSYVKISNTEHIKIHEVRDMKKGWAWDKYLKFF